MNRMVGHSTWGLTLRETHILWIFLLLRFAPSFLYLTTWTFQVSAAISQRNGRSSKSLRASGLLVQSPGEGWLRTGSPAHSHCCVAGVYQPGNVRLEPKILDRAQKPGGPAGWCANLRQRAEKKALVRTETAQSLLFRTLFNTLSAR